MGNVCLKIKTWEHAVREHGIEYENCGLGAIPIPAGAPRNRRAGKARGNRNVKSYEIIIRALRPKLLCS